MAITKVVDLQVNSNIKQTTADVNQLDNAVDKVAGSAGKMSGELNKAGGAKSGLQGITNAVTSLNPALAGAESGFKSVLVQMWALVANPIGAVIAAIVLGLTALYKAFTSTEQGAEKMEQVMSGISAVITVLRDRVLKVGEAIVKFFSGDFKGAIETGKEAVSGFGAEVAKEFNEAMEATKMLQEVEDAMRDLGVSRAKLNRDLARSKELITDETASYRDKKKAINEVREAEEKQTKSELEAAQKRVKALEIEANQSAGVSDEKRQALADAQAQLYQLEESSARDRRSLNKQERAIEKEAAAERKAIHDERVRQAKELAEIRKKEREDLNAFQIAVNNAGFEQRQLEIDDIQRQSDEIAAIEAKRQKDETDAANARIALAEAEKNAKIQSLDAVSNTLNMAADLAGRQTGVGKVLAIAAATISMFTSAQKAYESTVGIPFIGPTLAPINAGLAIAVGLKNIAAIKKVKVPGGGGGGSAPSAPNAGGNAPNFNVVGNSGVNQLAGVLSNKEQVPVKAYVVTSDVTSGQSVDRNTIRNASLG